MRDSLEYFLTGSDRKVVNRMTPAERFVVVAGVCLLVFNIILFSLCLSLVYDSKAAKNDTAHLINLTGRLVENQQATPLLMELLEEVRATQQEAKVADVGCPLLVRITSPTTAQQDDVTQEVTEVAQSTAAFPEETSQGLSDEERKIKSMEARIESLEKTVKDLERVLQAAEATTSAPINRRRRRNEEGTILLS